MIYSYKLLQVVKLLLNMLLDSLSKRFVVFNSVGSFIRTEISLSTAIRYAIVLLSQRLLYSLVA